ncbi:MAG: glycoside hydrolase family 16 protein, partial [Rhodoluna sp.]|nr:glycoside hydrolase family 16 protein [Rhodoluna sp.]
MNKTIRRRFIAASIALVSITLGSVSAQATAPSVTKPVKERLLWAQYFSEKAGSPVDKRYWTHDIGDGYGWGNNEKQYYTNKKQNISTNGTGHLVITALKLDENNAADMKYRCFLYLDCLYSSAKVVTRGKLGFQYGTISARIQTTEGVGMWPAFWMLGVPRSSCDGWPSCGEIDIVETRGSDPFVSVSSLHGPGYSGGAAKSNYYSAGNEPLSAGFHTYRVDWLPNSIKFYVDGQYVGGQRKSTIAPKDWVFNAEFYLILNLAV